MLTQRLARTSLGCLVARVGRVVAFFALALAMGGLVAAARAQTEANPAPAAAPAAPPAPVLAVPAARAAANVALITIKGPIDATTERSFKRRLAEAEKANAEAFVVEMDTPGGELGAVLEICRAIKGSSIANSVAWIRPSAYSGGAIIALACREIILSPGAVMGDAMIIAVSRLGQLNALPEAERQKLMAPLLVEITNSARLRGYDEKLVQGFISLGVELWLVESVREPGRLLFISRDEYALLFGSPPSPMTPSVPSAPAAPAANSTGAATLPQQGMAADGLPVQPTTRTRSRRGGSMGGPAGATPAPVDSTASPLVPAIPGLNPAVARTVSAGLVGKSTRPVLTAADAGQWTLLEYVCDGRGILTLTDAQLLRYGLAVHGASASGHIASDDDLKAFFQARQLIRLDQSTAETIAGWLSHDLARAGLVVLFLLGIFLEFAAPGHVIGSLLALVGLLGLSGPMIIFGLAGWWWSLSVVAGVILIAVEIFILPGFGVFGIAGLLALFGGLVGLVSPRSIAFDSASESSSLLTAVAMVAVATAIAGVATYFIARNFASMPLFKHLVLGPTDPAADAPAPAPVPGTPAIVAVGAEGIATTSLRPAGKARIGADLVDVVSTGGFIDSGTPVRVVEVSVFRVAVEPVRTITPSA